MGIINGIRDYIDNIRAKRKQTVIEKGKIAAPKKKESRTAVVYKGIGGVRWPEKDYQKYCEETYMKNVIGYRSIKLIADAFSSVNWGFFKQNTSGEKTEVFNTDYNKLLIRANPWESFNTVSYNSVAYLLLNGNAYIERVKPDNGPNIKVPKEIYTHQPDKMSYKLNDNTGRIAEYRFQDGSQNPATWPVDQLTGECDILHLKMFNPIDKHFGLSVTEPAAQNIDINNLATEWNMRLIQNENRPGMLLLFKGALTDEQYEKLEEQFDELKGPGNAGASLIIESDEGVVDAKPYSWNPKEMDWIEANRETARRISLAFGVPSMMLGIPGDNTYSNYAEARAAMWEDTVIPLLKYFKGEWNNWMFGDQWGQAVMPLYDFSLDDVPALQIRRDAIWKRASECTFGTVDEKRNMVGWQPLEEPDPKKPGSVLLVNSSQVPLDENFILPPEPEEELPPGDNPDDSPANEEDEE